MPKQTHETNIEGSETCIRETTQIILCFPEVFQQIMTGIVASSPRGTQTPSPTRGPLTHAASREM